MEQLSGITVHFTESVDKKTTYAYQLELAHKALESLIEKGKVEHDSVEHTLDESIRMLEFMDIIR